MITPRLFSHPAAEQLLPEVVGDRHNAKRLEIAKAQSHRCAISGYPYPALRAAPGQSHGSTYLVLDFPVVDSKGSPLSPTEAVKQLKNNGPSDKTLNAVCPLVFWSRHVDLAIKYGRGDVVFTPGLSQGEINTIFRSLMIGWCKGEVEGQNTELASDAGDILSAFDMTFGRHETLREAMCLPETTEWDTQVFLTTIQAMPERERSVYMRRFARHLRFWPNKEAFKPLGRYWGAVSHKSPATPADSSATWPGQYEALFKRLITETEKRRPERTLQRA